MINDTGDNLSGGGGASGSISVERGGYPVEKAYGSKEKDTELKKRGKA